MIRRTQTIYVTADPFFSRRGNVVHNFGELLERLAELEFPCVWLTSMTRFQIDEPRRRLGHGEPFIAESGSGVYLPEDYFHLKWGNTIRLGRYTVIPVAKPQPAAKDALDELVSDLDISIVTLRSLSHRELSQNTGLPANEAEQIRQRDFDELFFFAGATDIEIAGFAAEAKNRGLSLQSVGQFWSLSVGADLGKCIRELGGLYDRSLKYHAMRIGLVVPPTTGLANPPKSDPRLKPIYSACDRTLLLTERPLDAPAASPAGTVSSNGDEPAEEMESGEEIELTESPESGEPGKEIGEEADAGGQSAGSVETVSVEMVEYPRLIPDLAGRGSYIKDAFHLHAPDLWETVLASIVEHKPRK